MLHNGSGVGPSGYYVPTSTTWKGGILVSLRPSGHLWIESCLLCIFHDTCWIHLYILSSNFRRCAMCWIFGSFLNLLLWLCLVWLGMEGIWYVLIVWVIMGWQVVLVECRHYSCSSFPWSVIKSPRYTGGDFMFLYLFVRRRRRRQPQILVHVITFEQLFGFLSFLARLLALTCRLPD